MRLFVVLALVAFTGCHGNVLRSDQPHAEPVMKTEQSFWDSVVWATQPAQDALQSIRESEFVQQVNTKMKDSLEGAQQYAAILQDQAYLIGQESYKKVSEQVERLSERLWHDINGARAQLEPYTEKLKEKVEEHVLELQKSAAPWTEFFQTEMANKAKIVQETMEPYVEDLREKLEPYTKDFKSKFTTFWESFTETA